LLIEGLLISLVTVAVLAALYGLQNNVLRHNSLSTTTQMTRAPSVATLPPTGIVSRPTPTPLTPGDLPVVRIRYGEAVYAGLLGSYCWPPRDEPGKVHIRTRCVDTGFLVPTDLISIRTGDELTVEIDALKAPTTLSADVFMTAGGAPDYTVDLAPALMSTFRTDLPPGAYIIHVFGRWPEGDAYYAFKIEVR